MGSRRTYDPYKGPLYSPGHTYLSKHHHQSRMSDEELLTQEEMDAIGLQADQVQVLKKCFDGFADEEGAIPADQVGGILAMMGMKVKPSALREIIEDIDEDGSDCWSLESFASWPPSSWWRRTRRRSRRKLSGSMIRTAWDIFLLTHSKRFFVNWTTNLPRMISIASSKKWMKTVQELSTLTSSWR